MSGAAPDPAELAARLIRRHSRSARLTPGRSIRFQALSAMASCAAAALST